MLYLSNNGETCKDQLCQHPECWQTNIRRVREAVRQRNGIKFEEKNVNKQSAERFGDQEQRETESYSLPTLKIVDMAEDLVTPFNSREQVQGGGDEEKHLHSLMPHIPSCQSAPRARVPRTTPASPSLPEKLANRWKEKPYSFNENADNENVTTINFHEIYDYDEVCQDWQDMFLSTAYLVWCPSKKKRRKKERRASSARSEGRKGFKNPVEDMLPSPPERGRKKLRLTSSKVPTGGQPYSPCRSLLSTMYNFRSEDYISEGEYIMTLAKEDVPKSLIASKKILEQKPHAVRKNEQVMGLKKSSSAKVLVDISATLETPGEAYESQNVTSREKVSPQSRPHPECARLEKRKARFLKQPLDFESRRMLPLPSIAIPWGIIPDTRRRGHCKNSIPDCVDLDVMMEPVLYLPRTVSGSRSHVCADLGGKQEGMKERPRPGQTQGNSETYQERNLTSAYRLSPKNIGTPAPTPATPGARSSRRYRSGLRRTNTKDSLSRTRLYEVSETEHGDRDSSYSKSVSAVRNESVKVRGEEAILEVAESNRETSEPGIGNELSKSSLSQDNTDTNDGQKSIEAQSLRLDQVRDNESALSDRAVSPSSRTNIPPDIWAELHDGGSFDHRRIAPRSNSDLRNNVRSRSLFRSYHSSLGMSIYSYSGESNWKPHPPKLPKSFTYMGVYKPTILPKMPAALTVVPAPSSTRPSHVTKPREVKIHLSKTRSLRIPVVPTVSPVPNMDLAATSSASTVADTSTFELFSMAMKESEKPQSLASFRPEETLVERTPIPEEDSQESEYLISREIVQDTGVKLPLDNEDTSTERSVLQKGDDTALTVEILQDLLNNDKDIADVTHPCLSEPVAGKSDEFAKVSPGVACAKSQITGPMPEVPRVASETSTKSETVKPSIDENHSKNEILCTEDKIKSVAGEPAGIEGATTCIEGEIMNVEEGTTCMKEETTCIKDETTRTEHETSSSNEGITGSTEETTCTNDEIIASGSKVMCQTDVNTCTSDELACDTREERIPTHNDTPISIEMDESDTEPISVAQIDGTVEETTSPSNDDRLTQEKDISPDILDAQRSVHQSTSIMQDSCRSLMFPEEMKSIFSDTNIIPKVPSDFELTPLNVKSELLQPIEIDADLLVLSDSFMDLSLDDEKVANGGNLGADDDKETE